MSRLTLYQGLLRNLAGQIPEGRREHLSPGDALAQLRERTGQDFGEDVDAWRAWLAAEGLLPGAGPRTP